MSTVNTKHQIKSHEVSTSPPLRDVEIPTRTDRTEGKSVVSLGANVGSAVQYNTLSRTTYQHGKSAAKPGEPLVLVKNPTEIREETTGFKTFMRNKNFSFGDHGDGSLQTESRVTQSEAVENAKRLHSPAKVRDERNAHVTRMRSSHVFSGATCADPINSVSRVSYSESSSQVSDPHSRVAQIQHQRKAHGGTHFSFGDHVPTWQPESSTLYHGALPDRTQKCTRALECSIQFKAGEAEARDSLRSLKEIDYKKHDDIRRQPTAFSSSDHHMVMGYAPKELNSLSQVSYTPTRFVRQGASPAN